MSSHKKRQLKLTDLLQGEGKRPRKAVKEDWEETNRNGLRISLRQDFYDEDQSRRLFTSLEDEIEYLEGEDARVLVFGKWHAIPRKHVAYGDPGVNYTFSSRRILAKPWTPSLLEIREDLRRETGQSYNFVLVNRYADGSQKMGDHKDNEKEIDKSVPIASLSFGQERDFIFRHESTQGKKKNEGLQQHCCNAFNKLKLSLRTGSCLLMHYPTNETWLHGLPPRKSALGPRINLTFRRIML